MITETKRDESNKSTQTIFTYYVMLFSRNILLLTAQIDFSSLTQLQQKRHKKESHRQ